MSAPSGLSRVTDPPVGPGQMNGGSTSTLSSAGVAKTSHSTLTLGESSGARSAAAHPSARVFAPAFASLLRTESRTAEWWVVLAVQVISGLAMVSVAASYPHYTLSFLLPGPGFALLCAALLAATAGVLRLLQLREARTPGVQRFCSDSTRRDVGSRMMKRVAGRRSNNSARSSPASSPVARVRGDAAYQIARFAGAGVARTRELLLVQVAVLEAAIAADGVEATAVCCDEL